ncbi:hypothetical protein [Grimontia sp. SpTr1]|uniref:hypothetical protein n=1 Tax=Grimontia sp. SpTr1 TaxID=2995319 RepID=UPI00248C7268|nr:hypothetical protein [Grimontia sp. SpTr1]
MSQLSLAVSNLAEGRPFILTDDNIEHYPGNLSIDGSVPGIGEVEAELKRLTAEEVARGQVHRLRAAIASRAGDAESLLGTTADGVQLLLYGFSQLVINLHTAKDLQEVNNAAAPFVAMAERFLGKVEQGDVLLPFLTKGIDNVVADIESRATVVAQELEKER